MENTQYKRFFSYTLFILLLYPIAITPFTLFPWHFGKTAILQIIISLALILLLIFPFLRNKIEIYKHEWAFAIFIFAMALGGIFGINPVKSFWGDEARVTGVLTWVAFFALYILWRAYIFNNNELAKKAKIFFGIVVAFVGFTVLVQPWFPIMGVGAVSWFAGGRLSGIVGNPIFLATTLFMPLAFGLAMIFVNVSKKERIFWIIVSVIIVLAIFLSGTRGAFVGIATGVVVGFLALLFSKDSLLKKKTLVVFGIVVVLGFLTVAAAFTQFAAKNIPQLAAISLIKPGAFGASTRIIAWGSALQAFKQKPVFGWGPENFSPVFSMFFNPKLFEYSFREIYWDKAHNQMLEIAVGSGTVGVVAYLAFYFLLLYFLISNIRKSVSQKESIFYAILAGGFAGYFIQNLFIFDSPVSIFTFLFVMGSVIPVAPTGQSVQIVLNVWLKKILGFFAFLFLIYYIYANVIMLSVSYYIQNAGDWADINNVGQWIQNTTKGLSFNSPNNFEATRFAIKSLHDLENKSLLTRESLEKIFPVMEKKFEELKNRESKNFDYYLDKGEFYRVMGRFVDKKYFNEAWAAYGSAVELAPKRQDIYLVMGKTAILEGNFEKALQYNKKAVEIDQNIAPSHWFNGLVLVASGKENEGVISFEKAMQMGFSPDTDSKKYLIDLYAKRKEYDKIIPLYNDIIESEPKRGEWIIGLAATYFVLGDNNKAFELIDRAVSIDPTIEEKAFELLNLINNK